MFWRNEKCSIQNPNSHLSHKISVSLKADFTKFLQVSTQIYSQIDNKNSRM